MAYSIGQKTTVVKKIGAHCQNGGKNKAINFFDEYVMTRLDDAENEMNEQTSKHSE